MKKKTIAIAVTVALVVVAAIGATYAYFTAQKDVANTFSVGKVDISLNGITDTNAFNNLYPGQTITSVQPTVTNTGSNDAYVRLLVTVTYDKAKWDAALAEAYPTTTPTFNDFALNTLLNINSNWEFVPTATTSTANTVTYVFNYKSILKTTDGATQALFTNIAIPTAFGNKLAEVGQFGIKVNAQAIQSQSFDNAAAAYAAIK